MAVNKRDYYEVLGVAHGASDQDLKTAYRRLAHQFHPDKNQTDPEAEEKFKEAAEAYAILSNSEQRQRYDRFGHAGVSSSAANAAGGAPGFGGIEDILGDLFGFGDVFGATGRGGSRRSASQRGADLRYDLEITLEQAAEGMTAQLRIPKLETCETCTGSGARPGTNAEVCHTCQGAGQVRFQQGFFSVSRTCSSCRGAGQVISSPCETCRGSGRVEHEKSIEVKIPAGVETGSRLRLQAEGESGTLGGPPGDLYVVIHVAEHEEFERQANNLYAAVPVTFAQAALGAEVQVKTLTGNESLKVPAGTQTGTVFRVRGQGMPVLGGRGKGDLFVSVAVITPTSLTREQRKLLEQLARIETEDLQDKRLVDKVRDIFG
jgi:molecular chaperone DnaJ